MNSARLQNPPQISPQITSSTEDPKMYSIPLLPPIKNAYFTNPKPINIQKYRTKEELVYGKPSFNNSKEIPDVLNGAFTWRAHQNSK